MTIYSTKKKFSYILVSYDGKTPVASSDKIVVSLTANDQTNHHLIGNIKNVDFVIEKLKSGKYLHTQQEKTLWSKFIEKIKDVARDSLSVQEEWKKFASKTFFNNLEG